jgi:uracil-DNA glycosylase family protein
MAATDAATGSGADDRPGADEWVPDHPDLDALRGAAPACRGCELHRDATQVVFSAGPAGARLMLVGEQPGDREDLEGEPFVGPAGQLLDRAIEAAGIQRRAVYLTNAVKHFRHEGTRGKQRIHKSPARWQVAACEPWLLAELDAVRPAVVVLLGATAGQAVFGPSFRVGATRGRPVPWPEERLTVAEPPVCVATTHPSSVLRSRTRDADLAALVADLRVAAGLV